MKIFSIKNKPLFENDGVSIYRDPPPSYLEWAANCNAFFDGPNWGGILEKGFLAHRNYIWDQQHQIGHALTIFRKGPFRLGYLGFPVCCSASSESTEQYSLAKMLATVKLMPHKPELLRIIVSPFGKHRNDVACRKLDRTIESCIEDLPQWSANASAIRRRDMRRAQQHCTKLKFDTSATGDDLFALYSEALRRNQGRARYTRNYFEALSHALASPHLHLAALRDDQGLVCMAITARHGDTTYYLHGGTKPNALRAGASDIAMCEAIEHAQSTGSIRFNFLSSPADQPGLIRFKEKWGGVSAHAETYTFAMNNVGRLLAKYA